MDSAIKSKLQTLFRLGLVSQNNVRRAMTMFQDPEKYSKSPAYRTLMQELMVDVVDKIVNNRAMYTALRSSLTKDKGVKEADETIAATTQKIGEGVETDRTATLLRSGLVDKSQITAARKALKSKNNLKQMSTGKVYREMMINILDSLVKKITGSPALFNAFKFTMGKEGKIEEAFDGGDTDIIALFDLHEDAQEILEANKPTNPSLWSKAKSMARSKFDVYPSAYANGWAVKWYNSKGGGWKSVSEGKTFFQFANDLEEATGSEVRAKLQGLKKDYAKHSAEISKPVPPARGSTNPMARQDTKSGKMYWAADRRKKSGTGSKRASDADYRSDSVSESKEEIEQIDELSKATKDSYVAKRGSQLSSMMYGSGKHYASLTGRQQKNAVKGIKRATGVKEEAEQIDELSKKTLASYVKGAHRSQGQHEWESGNKAAKGEYHQNKKYIKREMGIGRALNRLQKD